MNAYLEYNPNVFRNKVILLPCDDPEWSNFTKYFAQNDAVKRRVYERQTEGAKAHGVSNCPLCALGHEATKAKIYQLSEMDADHVTAWSKGGATSEENCQMLCKTHNRSKGNR